MKMKRLFACTVLAIIFSLGDAFTKYGRSCQDIGCLSNEVCVLKEKPCTMYTRGDDCGVYPACEKVSGVARTCENYICPPSQICKIDKGVPKCFENPASTGMRENKRPVEAYNPISPNAENMPSAPVFPSNPNANYPHSNYPQQPQNPQNPQYPNSGMYPQLPSGGRQTTQRPNIYQSGHQYPSSGGGYVGGQVGSGYPGYPPQQTNVIRQGGGYPVQGGGYPVQGSGYPGQPYQGQGGYNTNNNVRYPQQPGYPSQGNYYPNQNNYGQNRNPYGQQSSNSNPILDKITNTLKNLGLFWFLISCISTRLFH